MGELKTRQGTEKHMLLEARSARERYMSHQCSAGEYADALFRLADFVLNVLTPHVVVAMTTQLALSSRVPLDADEGQSESQSCAPVSSVPLRLWTTIPEDHSSERIPATSTRHDVSRVGEMTRKESAVIVEAILVTTADGARLTMEVRQKCSKCLAQTRGISCDLTNLLVDERKSSPWATV